MGAREYIENLLDSLSEEEAEDLVEYLKETFFKGVKAELTPEEEAEFNSLIGCDQE